MNRRPRRIALSSEPEITTSLISQQGPRVEVDARIKLPPAYPNPDMRVQRWRLHGSEPVSRSEEIDGVRVQFDIEALASEPGEAFLRSFRVTGERAMSAELELGAGNAARRTELEGTNRGSEGILALF